jgi:hypothetical protein
MLGAGWVFGGFDCCEVAMFMGIGTICPKLNSFSLNYQASLCPIGRILWAVIVKAIANGKILTLRHRPIKGSACQF